jgi:CO/xanthine dehydrogenase FAD-binding subunit
VVTLSFKPDEYIKVKTVDEVITLLQEHGEGAAIIAGGTELHQLAEGGMIPQVKKLIDIEQLDLSYIESSEEGIRIGAATNLRNIMDYPLFQKEGAYTGLHEAAKILPIQVLGLGTIGGNICSGLPILNFPSVVSMLDAELKTISSDGDGSIPANEFFIDYFLTALQPNEFLTEIRIPRLPERTGSVFLPFKLLAMDFPTASIAARVTLSEDETCEDVRIVFGSLGRIPFRAKRAEGKLKGKSLEDKTIGEAAKAVLKEIDPISDLRGSAEYKKELSRVLTEQALVKAKKRALG